MGNQREHPINATVSRGEFNQLNLPNLISLARLLSVPVLVYLILNGLFLAAFWLFVAAGISDALDGFIAKRWNMTSEFGTYLDPIADKALLVGTYVTLAQVSQIPLWIVILVVFRDVIIVGGVIMLHLTSATVNMKPLAVSKINTATQIFLAVYVLAELGWEFSTGDFRIALVYLVGATTIVSGGAYILNMVRSDAAGGEGSH